MLKDLEPSGQMLYGIETPDELVKKYAENPLNEHSKGSQKNRRKNRREEKLRRKRNKY